ncbi:MAG: hypothetical protein AAFY60_17430, partial [Myxococcota bacterium]
MPGLGQVISAVGLIGALGEAFGQLFGGDPEQPMMERLGNAAGSLMKVFAFGLGAFVPGAGVIGPALAGLYGMYAGGERMREEAAQERREQRERLGQQPAAPVEEPAAPAGAPVERASEPSIELPPATEALTDATAAIAYRDALNAIADSIRATTDENALQALQAQQRQIQTALHAAIDSMGAADRAALDAEVLSALSPVLAEETLALLAPS